MTAALADARDEVAAEAQALGDKAGEKAAVEADAVKDEAVRALEAFRGRCARPGTNSMANGWASSVTCWAWPPAEADRRRAVDG